MDAPSAGISDADWLATPIAVRVLIMAQQAVIEQLHAQLTALATEQARLGELIGRSSRNSSKPFSRDGPGFEPPVQRKGSGRKQGHGSFSWSSVRPPGGWVKQSGQLSCR